MEKTSYKILLLSSAISFFLLGIGTMIILNDDCSGSEKAITLALYLFLFLVQLFIAAVNIQNIIEWELDDTKKNEKK